MYRSNDVVQFDSNFIYIRPFVKVGEPSDSVKVYKYFMEKTRVDLSKIQKYEENGPDKRHFSNGEIGQPSKISSSLVLGKKRRNESKKEKRGDYVRTQIAGVITRSKTSRLMDQNKVQSGYQASHSEEQIDMVEQRFSRLQDAQIHSCVYEKTKKDIASKF